MSVSPLAEQRGAARLTEQNRLIPVIVRTFAPLPPLLSIVLPASATIDDILDATIQHSRLSGTVAGLLRLKRIGGQSITPNTTLGTLTGSSVINAQGQNVISPITLEVRVGLKGGKGGFGSMLRAQGGKMSSNRNGEENNDSCRDLNGRRLSTVKQARQLAVYLSNEAEREKELSEIQKKKYAKLEKMLGRKPRGESDFVEAAQKLHEQGGSLEDGDGDFEDKGEGSSSVPSTSRTKAVPKDAEYKGKKRERIEDSEYIEQSREIVDNVRSAVASAMMKKKKKTQKQKAVTPSKGEQNVASVAAQAA
ncbi:hypothetical protein CBS101457_001396 [Exobasidium rhododendri]|nr:hypothetical protein CBS101457_001396 [Exobasidium rhododendri]